MAHEYKANIQWTRNGAVFTDNRYSRGHVWRFDGLEVLASSAPAVVPLPFSVAEAVDPEEAFIASLASCHMLFFLSFAAKGGFVVERYEDAAVGVMGKNECGKMFVSKVSLNPSITFTGTKQPTEQEIQNLHHRSHEECFIANSVVSEIAVENSNFSFESVA